jgi:hypothetical protein
MEKNKDLYLPPDAFFEELLRSKIDGKVSDRLARMFMLLAEKTTQHRYWSRYTHIKQDMISEAVLVCVSKGFAKFKPFPDGVDWDGKSIVKYNYLTCYNPHAFFTKCIFNALKAFMKAEYGVTNVRNKIRLENGLETTYGYDTVLEKEFGVDGDDEKSPFENQEYEDDPVAIDDYEGHEIDE